MNHNRVNFLADGIFAIVMTLLVIEIKTPAIHHASNADLLHALADQKVLFISYFLSFALLFTYWRAHNFIMSTLVKNVNMTLINLNMLFLSFVALVPYSSHFLSEHFRTEVGIILYAVNVIIIGLSLSAIRIYAERSSEVETIKRSVRQKRNANIRMLTPVVFSAAAIIIAPFSTIFALGVLVSVVFFNLLNNSADLLHKIFGR